MQRLTGAEVVKVFEEGRRADRGEALIAFRLRGDLGPPKFAFAAAKGVGGAVKRNRMKRRLKEIVRAETGRVKAGCDYVLVARAGATGLRSQELGALIWRILEDIRPVQAGRGDS